MRIATWNLEWAKPGTDRHERCIAQLEGLHADVIVTTEHYVHDWEMYPYRIDAGTDWGYVPVDGRRKVIAWSKTPWTDTQVDSTGSFEGRFMRSTTQVDGLPPLNVISVCIPWRDAHVRSGRKDRRIWDEHREFLSRLADQVSDADADSPTVVVGDFNQRLPRTRQPLDVHAGLMDALANLTVVTAGEFACGTLIDHVALSDDFVVTDVEAWPNEIDGTRLSDHSGVAVSVIDAHRDEDLGRSHRWVGPLMDPPRQWGLRGDPHLWGELRAKLGSHLRPANESDMRRLVIELIDDITGIDVTEDPREAVLVPHLPRGGMSGGHIDPSFWKDSALPLITQRFTEST